MSEGRKQPVGEQFDLFLPYIADLHLRDQREMMERPFFSLAKSKRVKPIDYTSPDGKLWVHVSANPDYGMATIWDADILIYCASVLADMARRGRNDIPRKLHLMPYDLLRAIRRPTTGRAYELLGQALDRLVSTTIKTNIRAENRREATFSWLDGWTQLVDERTERSRGMTIELSNWFYEGVLMKGGVLSIDRAYFDITGGRERWLYKVARPIPADEELVDARSLVRGAVAGLSDAATRGFLTDQTIDLLRRECPGWDLYALHAEFEAWTRASPDRTPANWQKAFIGWVRRHHARHRHELRG
jgi:plasmid replication initiation protein